MATGPGSQWDDLAPMGRAMVPFTPSDHSRLAANATHNHAVMSIPVNSNFERSLRAHRQSTYRLGPQRQITSLQDAISYVNERGFIYFWPIKDILLPSLWVAVAGEREVADAHDDPGHVTWGWKDQSLDKRWWYYAKVLRGRATLIAQPWVTYFYALSHNYGDPDRDYLDLYQDGLLSYEARHIYETLLASGPMDTVNLRRTIHMTSKASNSPFERALTQLQRDFKILPVGVAQTGAWRYSFIYECVHRWYPHLAEEARAISQRQARAELVAGYLQSVGAATRRDMRLLFQWQTKDLEQGILDCEARGDLQTLTQPPSAGDEWLVTSDLVT